MRRSGDAYFTIDSLSAGCVEAFMEFLPLELSTLSQFRVLEPSVGDLSFVRGIQDYITNKEGKRQHIDSRVFNVTGVDITRPRTAPGYCPYFNYHFIHNDITKLKTIPQGADGDLFSGPFDLMLGNPPYVHAEEHLWHIFEFLAAPTCMAGFLLRAGFAESLERIAFFKKFPIYGYFPITKRPSFTGDGKTDGTAYAFFIFYRYNYKWLAAENIKHIKSNIPPAQRG